jgi:hypothetical protein
MAIVGRGQAGDERRREWTEATRAQRRGDDRERFREKRERARVSGMQGEYRMKNASGSESPRNEV